MGREVETTEYGQFCRRVLRALTARAVDPPGDLEALKELRDLIEHASTLLDVAAVGCHDNGHTWTAIARKLGTTRQNAHARWGGGQAAAPDTQEKGPGNA